MGARTRKVASDLFHNKARSALVVMSMCTGVFAVGLVAGAYRTLLDSMDTSYKAAHPADAILYFRDPIPEDLHETVRNFRGIREAQSRRSLEVRTPKGPDEWKSLNLIAIQDFKDIRLSKIRHLTGRWPPAQDEVLLERSSMEYFGARIGDTLEVETPLRKKRTLRVSGSVADMGQPSAFFTGRMAGYISFDTVEALGELRQPDQLLLSVEKEKPTRKEIQNLMRNVRNRLDGSGYPVVWTRVPPPGEHPASDPINTLLLILGALGGVVMLLSGFLLVNTISALLTQQTRQIGVMKAVGATAGQIAWLYIALVVIYSTFSVLLAIPLAFVAARAACQYVANLLNMDLLAFDVPREVLGAEIALGYVVPLVAAAFPISKAARITVREAVNYYGVSGGGFGGGWMDRWIARVKMFTRPALLSLRNTFRRKGRLALTLATLSMGGAIFMGVFSVRSALLDTLDEALKYWNYDVEADFVRPYRVDQLQQEVQAIDGVVRAETWGFAAAQLVDDWNGKDENRILLIAPPADTDMLRPALVGGRWLRNDDEAAVVINTEVLKNSPNIKVGDVVKIRLGLRKTEWKVVGLVRSVMAGPFVYANRPYYAYVSGEGSRASSLQIITRQRDVEFQQAVAQKLEERFKKVGIQVNSVSAADEWKSRAVKQFEVIIGFLLVMAMLMAVVGALALMGTMGINVLERTREVGIIRAVGATTTAVLGIFVLEGVTIGLISWVIGLVTSIPMALILSRQVGMMFMRAPLDFSFSTTGVLIWLVLIVILSAAASILPALKAARLSVREVLAAE